MLPDSLAVLGLGATGASAAWAARTAGVPRVLGWAASRADATSALRVGAVDDLADRADRAVAGAAVVLVADTPGGIDQVLRRVAGSLRPEALLLLVSEVHGAALATAGTLGRADCAAAIDPMGESPGAGFSGAGPDRFRGRLTYVSAVDTDAGHQAARNAMSFVEEVLGGAPVLIDPARHDEQVAWTRQLPGAALAVICHLLDGRRLGGVTWDAAARSARAGVPADAEVAADVLLADRRAVAMALGALGAEVEVLRKLVEGGDLDGVRAFLDGAAKFRPGPS